MSRKKKGYVDYQQRSYDLNVGDAVIPQYDENTSVGRIVALYPAIGMADVQFTYGQGRYPVEDIERVVESELGAKAPNFESIPGGAGTVSVPGGPRPKKASASRVASDYIKIALYWDQGPRIYRATKPEQDGSGFFCPKCRSPLQLRKYKIQGKLFVCPDCNFMIKRENVKGSGFEKPGPPEITESGEVSGLVLGGKK